MNNIGNKILIKQNETKSIDQLLAQQNIYSIAKILQGILIFITVPLPLLLAFILKHYPNMIDEKNWYFVLYLILAVFVEKILESYIDRFKKLAASIQEIFDLNVLNIKENETLNTVNVDDELIRRYSKNPRKDIQKVEKVTNWYSLKIENVVTNIASILCQRTNIYYDFSVRKRYNWLVKTLSLLTFTCLFVISLRNDLSIKIFIIEVLLPSTPAFLFAYKEVNSNTESIDNLEHLKDLIEENLNELQLENNVDESLLRKIQDRIYTNRILSPLIPDIIYKIIRPRLEDEMNYSVETRIEKLIRT